MNHCGHALSIAIHDRELRMVLRTGSGPVTVTVACDPAVARAVHHCHGPTGECSGVSRAMVDTTRRVLEVFGGAISRVLVRPGPEPAFWVRVGDHDGWRELHLDVLSAVALIASGRVPIELVDDGDRDWDTALRTLTDPG